jgi:hemerythrin-like domain-containing protein
MMRIIEEIRHEHELVEEIAGALRFWADRGADHFDAAADKADLIRFIRGFILSLHFGNEERLFDVLVEHGEIPGHRGPLAILRREHDEAARAIDRFESLGADETATDLAIEIAAELWQHMDKEDSVLMPEAERRLIDGGIRDVELPPKPEGIEEIRELGHELVRRLPPMEDPDLIRGDGCIPCAAFGEECHGIETEWWSEWEHEHHASLDEG